MRNQKILMQTIINKLNLIINKILKLFSPEEEYFMLPFFNLMDLIHNVLIMNKNSFRNKTFIIFIVIGIVTVL